MEKIHCTLLNLVYSFSFRQLRLFACLSLGFLIRGEADMIYTECIDPVWKLPRGSYITQLCPAGNDQKNCVKNKIPYRRNSKILVIPYVYKNRKYDLHIRNICRHVQAGFDIKITETGNPEFPVVLLIADQLNDDRYLRVNQDRELPVGEFIQAFYQKEVPSLQEWEMPYLLNLLYRSDVKEYCDLKYYFESDLLAGTCNYPHPEPDHWPDRESASRPEGEFFIVLANIRAKSAAVEDFDKALINDSGRRNYLILAIKDKKLELTLKYRCEDFRSQHHCDKFYGEGRYTEDVICSGKRLISVQINNQSFCHDRAIHTDIIQSEDFMVSSLAVDTINQLVVVQTHSGEILYMPNSYACLETGSKMIRSESNANRLACIIERSDGLPLSPDNHQEL